MLLYRAQGSKSLPQGAYNLKFETKQETEASEDERNYVQR